MTPLMEVSSAGGHPVLPRQRLWLNRPPKARAADGIATQALGKLAPSSGPRVAAASNCHGVYQRAGVRYQSTSDSLLCPELKPTLQAIAFVPAQQLLLLHPADDNAWGDP